MQAQLLTAPIVAVEVFRSSALVHRRAEVAGLTDGAMLEIVGLPLELQDSSVRVALQPAEGCRVVDVRAALHIAAPPAEASLPALEEVKRLRREITQLEQRRARLAHQADELQRLRPVLPPPPRKPGDERFAQADPVPAWISLAAFSRGQAERRLAEVARIDDELRDQSELLLRAEEQLTLLSGAARRELEISKRLQIHLAGGAPRQIVEVTYQVMGARWFPTYELRVEGGQRAELLMSALVAQVTGEDWGDIPLTLSTADLQRSCTLPELLAWRIGRARPVDRRLGWRPLPTDLSALFCDFDRCRPPEAPRITPRPVDLPGHAPAQVHAPMGETQVMDRLVSRRAKTPTGEIYSSDQETPTVGWQSRQDSYGGEAGSLSDAEEELGLRAAPEMAPPCAAPAAPVQKSVGLRQVMAPRSPQPMMAKDALCESPAEKKRSREEPAARPHRALPPPPPGEVAPGEELLTYGNLVLGAPDESERGTLRLQRQRELLPAEWRESEEALAILGVAEFHRTKGLADLDALSLPAHVQPVGESAGNFACRYLTSLTGGISADGQLHRIPVLRAATPLQMTFRTAPLADTAVYRVATLRNPIDRPLLAGPLDVFWEGDYLVTSALQTTATGAAIDANLGVEPTIKVVRNVHHAQREAGILAGRTIYDEEIAIEVETHRPEVSAVEVLERLPITEDRKIEIKVVEETPAAEPYEQKERLHPVRGGRRWRLSLEPGGRARCVLRYQVELPAKSEIVGGGRRA
jgi:hypothetical protein